ncbi:Abi family protein [Companilactobacillus mishanensis]|uniref:Abi family protein n=1 Tax=Companilactobacillus mishanensis TaxID=2486008 RepID=A0A5P0ZL95_9LACO|nr:Abi family protein [Companilactobacillus mishanensis]MQS53437.1 Abi family protein [Companilactobacillus mishanensis]
MQSKEFESLDSQIDTLRTRGMVINDYERCKRFLLTNNYYNIINGYSKYFQVDHHSHNDKYVNGVTFDEVCELYFFETEIKQTIFRATLDVEHHLKSIFAHRFAETQKNKRYAYLDVNCYADDKILEVGYLISKISRIINKNKKYPNNAIYHYVRKYNDVPIWVLIDFLDFGTLTLLISCVPKTLQNRIAQDVSKFIRDNNHDFGGQFSPDIMNSFIANIRQIRNVCAHNNRLLDYTCNSDTKYFHKLHNLYNISSESSRTRAYSTFINMQCFLSPTEFAVLNNTLRKRFRNLSNHLKTISINEITSSLGFPNDWQNRSAIVQ